MEPSEGRLDQPTASAHPVQPDGDPPRAATGALHQSGDEEPARKAGPITLSKGGDPGKLVEQVGRYRILDKLGQGGMATVFKAYDPSIDRTIAIKFLHTNLCLDEAYRGRFLREAKAAGSLSHQNIVTVHDVGEIEGRPYIAMELLEGTPLSDLIAADERLTLREVTEIGIQLARALDFAHSRGVLHRDIKPANIVRLRNSNNVKVTDFGIARIETGEATQHTQIGDVLGTPHYMSPEQAMGLKVDARSDLFSAGIVLYELLTGHRPFEGDSVVSLIYRIAKEEPTPAEKLRGDLPPSLRRIVERLLRKQPEKRFQTGHELSAALVEVIHELDASAQQEERPRIVPLRVRWSLIMATVAAVTMAITATVVNQRQYAALMDQVMDYGASLSRFMATESAVPALSEDWIAVEVFVQEVMKTQDFQGITVLDYTGTVRASSQAEMVGKSYAAPPGEALGARNDGVAVISHLSAEGAKILDFAAPITFHGKTIGQVHLGIPEQPLSKVARLSLMMIALLVATTVAAVALASYFMANRFAQPARLLETSLGRIARGEFDYRIAEQRNDEFGQLYQAFDKMAQALEQGQAKTVPAPPLAEEPPATEPAPPVPAA